MPINLGNKVFDNEADVYGHVLLALAKSQGGHIVIPASAIENPGPDEVVFVRPIGDNYDIRVMTKDEADKLMEDSNA